MNIQGQKFVRFEDWSSEHSTSPTRRYSIGEGFYESKARPAIDAVHEKLKGGWDSSYERIKGLKERILRGHKPENESSFASTKLILDPQDSFLQKWNKLFMFLCVFAVSIDPLFFYVPVVQIEGDEKCLALDKKLETTACVLRTLIDIIYVLRICFQFRTGFIAPSSRVFGRGELVTDPIIIARRYLISYFLVDFLSIVPLPQIVVLIVVPNLKGQVSLDAKNMLKVVVLAQYVPRIARIIPLFNEVHRTSGILTETPWAGAAYNLLLYMLASHIFGAFWYLFAIERQDVCWRKVCSRNAYGCKPDYLYCGDHRNISSKAFLNLTGSCPFIQPDDIKNSTTFNFGIYTDALDSGVVESNKFLEKMVYCFWWGLRNLSSLGQNLKTSTNSSEVLFAILISVSGLVLFSLLIGNMQKYLQSTTKRVEEMRVKRRDAEQWMSHRLLPDSLRERIRKYEQYKWQETRGVEERTLIRNYPKDLRREINRHLCLDLLKRVPMFEKMDEQILDAVCDRLKPALYTKDSYIVREGDPVDEMIFIIRGNLVSVTTNGGRTGFFNAVYLHAGDFCGEGLLTWALDPQSSSNLPISSRTVQALTEVEAFALVAEDLKSVASQFRRLHHKDIQHTFRFCSVQWRTWAACFIQAAWRRYYKRKQIKSLREAEDKLHDAMANEVSTTPSFGATVYASQFAANILRNVRQHSAPSPRMSQRLPLLPLKPAEPDFSSRDH